MTSLQVKWNLKLNKRKSEILTAEKIEEINGVKCSTSVKYLGVRVAVDGSRPVLKPPPDFITSKSTDQRTQERHILSGYSPE
jgi:hypothetical protein